MKKSKLLIIIVSTLVAIPVVVFAFVAIVWLSIFGAIWLSPDPPKPQTTYGEFSFELVYSIDGEIVTVNDVYICEYDGIGMDEGSGKYIEWKGYIKSSNQEELVLFYDKGKKIICNIGSPDYYMGDPEYYETYGTDDVVPNLTLIEDYGDITSSHLLSEEEMKNYKIELISWKFSKPINNKFE